MRPLGGQFKGRRAGTSQRPGWAVSLAANAFAARQTIGLTVSLMVGLTVGLMVVLMVGPTVSLMVGLTVGLMVGPTVGLMVGPTVDRLTDHPPDRRPDCQALARAAAVRWLLTWLRRWPICTSRTCCTATSAPGENWYGIVQQQEAGCGAAQQHQTHT